ncbi:MAG: hypothetical protein Q8N88_01345 [Nanoarchaeota archaeon]|nr:hypothetical protein [Nanoarchaeota archaeon]
MAKKRKRLLKRTCASCGKKIKVILYEDRSYRGGHYFGKMQLGNNKLAEYWECPKCYW